MLLLRLLCLEGWHLHDVRCFLAGRAAYCTFHAHADVVLSRSFILPKRSTKAALIIEPRQHWGG